MQTVSLVKNRCPHCGKGHVYKGRNLAAFQEVEMNHECEECHLSFTKDPGFYWGSMYVSYGLGLLEVLITYFLCRLVGTQPFDLTNLVLAIMVVLLLAPFNFRMSRLLWLHLFPND